MKKRLMTDKAPAAAGPYSQGIDTGQLVFVSGQIPPGRDGELAEGSVAGMTALVLSNIEAVLKEAGLSRDNIVKTTVFLTDMEDFPEMNRAYGEFFEGTVFPARSTIAVKGLPMGSPIEIEAIAAR